MSVGRNSTAAENSGSNENDSSSNDNNIDSNRQLGKLSDIGSNCTEVMNATQ